MGERHELPHLRIKSCISEVLRSLSRKRILAKSVFLSKLITKGVIICKRFTSCFKIAQNSEDHFSSHNDSIMNYTGDTCGLLLKES
jgi:hypothetical protein